MVDKQFAIEGVKKLSSYLTLFFKIGNDMKHFVFVIHLIINSRKKRLGILCGCQYARVHTYSTFDTLGTRSKVTAKIRNMYLPLI